MRFQLKLTCEPPQYLPFNYQYPLSAWIYKTFNEGDPEFAQWLHSQGYTDGTHHYKLFTFSWLKIPKVRPMPEQQCLAVDSDQISFVFSLPMETAAETFIKGLFQQQVCEIGAGSLRASFRVQQVEKLPDPELGTSAAFRCLSPIVVSKAQHENGKLKAKYLSPEDEGYQKQLINNLIQRYQTAVQYQYQASAPEYELLDGPDSQSFDFQLLSKPRSKLVTIKENTAKATKLKGYQFNFQLTAPQALFQFAYAAGIGEKGSLGFGCIEPTTKPR